MPFRIQRIIARAVIMCARQIIPAGPIVPFTRFFFWSYKLKPNDNKFHSLHFICIEFGSFFCLGFIFMSLRHFKKASNFRIMTVANWELRVRSDKPQSNCMKPQI